MPVICSASPRAAISVRELFRKQGAKLASNGVLPGHAEKLLHARVPGFDDAFQIHGENADVQGFDDVFAEVFEARDLEGFLFERGIKLRVIESHGDVACNRFHELDVIAGKIVAVDGLPEAQNGHGVFADAAGNVVIEVELFERSVDGFADIARGAGRLKKERPPRKLGPGRAEETKIERFRETHAHRASQAEIAGIGDVLDKNRQAIDEKRLRDAVHHGAEHGLKPHFVGERAAEFDQGAAIVQTVAIEEAIETRLNPFAERLEEKRGDDDGDDAADGSVRLRMKNLGDQRHEEEVNRGDRSRGRRIGQAAFEDDVHIHQAVTNDGVAEAQAG